MSDHSLLRLQSWLSPSFPTGAYAYSHGLEWAVDTGHVRDRDELIDWLAADLRHGSGRNEAIFFVEAWRCATAQHDERLFRVAALAAAFRGTSELALESSQQGCACLATLRRAWPDRVLERLSERMRECDVAPVLSVVLGARAARERLPMSLALSLFLQAQIANLVTAGVRLIPLGQTDGQLAIAGLEETILATREAARTATLDELGSAAFMVDMASTAHEMQYTRLFRS